MRAEQWLQQQQAGWTALEQELPAFEDRKPLPFSALCKVLHLYPELARDTAVARRLAPGSRNTAHLEALYRRLHAVLYQPRPTGATELVKVLREDIPAICYALRWQLFSVAVGLLLSALAGWWLVNSYPELAALFASEGMLEAVEGGELWTEGLLNILPSSVLSLQILSNNIVVTLTALCLGVLFGLGTVYIIGLNGLMLGGVFALTAQHGLAGDLFDFVVAHGCVELSIVVVAGAAGFAVGEALARPGPHGRMAPFREAVQRGTKLMGLCVVFLVGAGLIEGYISPDPAVSRDTRIAIGLAYWLLFIFALCGWRLPWRRQADRRSV